MEETHILNQKDFNSINTITKLQSGIQKVNHSGKSNNQVNFAEVSQIVIPNQVNKQNICKQSIQGDRSSQRASINSKVSQRTKIKNIGAIKKVPPEIHQIPAEPRQLPDEKVLNQQPVSKKTQKTVKSVKYHQGQSPNQQLGSLKQLEDIGNLQAKSQKTENIQQSKFSKSQKNLQEHNELLKRKIEELEKRNTEKNIKQAAKSSKSIKSRNKIQIDQQKKQSDEICKDTQMLQNIKQQNQQELPDKSEKQQQLFDWQLQFCRQYIQQVYKVVKANIWSSKCIQAIEEQQEVESYIGSTSQIDDLEKEQQNNNQRQEIIEEQLKSIENKQAQKTVISTKNPQNSIQGQNQSQQCKIEPKQEQNQGKLMNQQVKALQKVSVTECDQQKTIEERLNQVKLALQQPKQIQESPEQQLKEVNQYFQQDKNNLNCSAKNIQRKDAENIQPKDVESIQPKNVEIIQPKNGENMQTKDAENIQLEDRENTKLQEEELILSKQTEQIKNEFCQNENIQKQKSNQSENNLKAEISQNQISSFNIQVNGIEQQKFIQSNDGFGIKQVKHDIYAAELEQKHKDLLQCNEPQAIQQKESSQIIPQKEQEVALQKEPQIILQKDSQVIFEKETKFVKEKESQVTPQKEQQIISKNKQQISPRNKPQNLKKQEPDSDSIKKQQLKKVEQSQVKKFLKGLEARIAVKLQQQLVIVEQPYVEQQLTKSYQQNWQNQQKDGNKQVQCFQDVQKAQRAQQANQIQQINRVQQVYRIEQNQVQQDQTQQVDQIEQTYQNAQIIETTQELDAKDQSKMNISVQKNSQGQHIEIDKQKNDSKHQFVSAQQSTKRMSNQFQIYSQKQNTDTNENQQLNNEQFQQKQQKQIGQIALVEQDKKQIKNQSKQLQINNPFETKINQVRQAHKPAQKFKFNVVKKDLNLNRQNSNKADSSFNKSKPKLKTTAINSKNFLEKNIKQKQNLQQKNIELPLIKNNQKRNTKELILNRQQTAKKLPRASYKSKGMLTQASASNFYNVQPSQSVKLANSTNTFQIKRLNRGSSNSQLKKKVPISKIIKSGGQQNIENVQRNPSRQIRIIKKSPYGIIQFVLVRHNDKGSRNKVKNARIIKDDQAKQRRLNLQKVQRLNCSTDQFYSPNMEGTNRSSISRDKFMKSKQKICNNFGFKTSNLKGITYKQSQKPTQFVQLHQSQGSNLFTKKIEQQQPITQEY